jgi:hypothetical protein
MAWTASKFWIALPNSTRRPRRSVRFGTALARAAGGALLVVVSLLTVLGLDLWLATPVRVLAARRAAGVLGRGAVWALARGE